MGKVKILLGDFPSVPETFDASALISLRSSDGEIPCPTGLARGFKILGDQEKVSFETMMLGLLSGDANWLRDSLFITGNGYGSCYGSGFVCGNGDGDGYGFGFDDGSGSGSGFGSGYGCDNGYGSGRSSGRSSGYGCGSGYDSGYGAGQSYGNYSGHCYGNENLDGSGSGSQQ